ncbi:MAG: cyclodeaminase/cyclohydrolase family protein [Caldilineaceae bacterium]
MATIAESTISDFLDALASGNSTPGGGGAAALTGSQAAALLSMVINFTVGRPKYAEVEEEMQSYLQHAEALRGELYMFINKDAEAFEAVSACYGMPRSTDEEKQARTAALQQAMRGATEVPYQVAERCLVILQMAKPVAEKGNANVVSDAATAAHLAFGALLSALVNVNINLKYIKDETFTSEWSAKAQSLVASAQMAYNEARTACTETLGVTV